MTDSNALTALLAAARAVHFGACLLLLGVWVFDCFIAGPRGDGDALGVGGQSRTFARGLGVVALPLALLSAIGWFGVVAINMGDGTTVEGLQPGNLALVWNHTQFGLLWKWRLAIWLLACVAGFWERRSGPGPARWLMLFSCAALVGSLAWAGHGRIGRPPGWHLAADAIHLLAAGCWPAGLLPFAVGFLKVRHNAGDAAWAALCK